MLIIVYLKMRIKERKNKYVMLNIKKNTLIYAILRMLHILDFSYFLYVQI